MLTENRVPLIVVGVDGSEHSAEALKAAISLARPLNAEIVAVYAIAPSYMAYAAGFGPVVYLPEPDVGWQAASRHEFEPAWRKPLEDSGLKHRTLVEEGHPATVIAAVAEREGADLVVVGRRGLGGVAEMLLGSVSHQLSHHCKVPVLLVPNHASAGAMEPSLSGGDATSESRPVR